MSSRRGPCPTGARAMTSSQVVLPLLSALLAAEPETRKGLVLHEWGVFRAHEDQEVANADVLAEWDDLPDFIYGNIVGRQLPVNFGAYEIRRRPVIFFHSAEAVQVRLKI